MNVSSATRLAPAASSVEAPPAAAPRVPLRSSNTRETLLDAAEAVVLASGAVHLTLDAVAERAGVSKGGLLYNFRSKDALLQAMVDRNMHRLRQDHAAALAGHPASPGGELKAFARMAAQRTLCSEKRLGGALLAASAQDPRLLEPVHRFHRWRLEMVDNAARDGLPFERTALASLALDGLCMLEMLGLSPYTDEQRRRILDELVRFIDELAVDAPATAVATHQN